LSTLDGRRQRTISEALRDLGRTLWTSESWRIPQILEVEDFRKDRKEAGDEVLTDLSEECDLRTETFAAAAVQRSTTPPRQIDLGLVVLSLQLVVGALGILPGVQRFEALDPVVEVAEKAKVLELAAAAAWKVMWESAEELSERQKYLKVLELVAKMLDPSRASGVKAML
jgi:hypothetical protein